MFCSVILKFLLLFFNFRQVVSAENLTPETRQIMEEVTRFLNLEKLLPCYRHTVTVRYGGRLSFSKKRNSWDFYLTEFLSF